MSEMPAQHSARNGRHETTRNRTAITAATPVGAVALIASIVSYTHIVALGLRAHQGSIDAHLLPFAVDGLIVGGVVIVLFGYGLGWLAISLGVAATVFANVESGLPYGPLAATIAAWPAVAFSVASFVLERWLKTRCLPDLNADAPAVEVTPEVTPAPPVQVIAEPVSGQAPEVISGQPEVTIPATPKAKPRRKPAARPARISDADLKQEIRAEFDADPSVSVNAAAKKLGRSRDRVRPLLEQVRAEANVRPLERKKA
jgi:hypothetical protein